LLLCHFEAVLHGLEPYAKWLKAFLKGKFF